MLVGLAMAVGIAGTVVPVVPGLVLVWAGALVYGLLTGFGAVGVVAFAVITVLAAAGTAAGVVLPHRAAAAGGAPRRSVLLAAAAGLVGFFVIPVVGLPLGMAGGLFVAEFVRTRDAARAWASTWTTVKGFGWATLAQFAAGLAMAMVWLAWVVVP